MDSQRGPGASASTPTVLQRTTPLAMRASAVHVPPLHTAQLSIAGNPHSCLRQRLQNVSQSTLSPTGHLTLNHFPFFILAFLFFSKPSMHKTWKDRWPVHRCVPAGVCIWGVCNFTHPTSSIFPEGRPSLSRPVQPSSGTQN
jgi:hypothetical protein